MAPAVFFFYGAGLAAVRLVRPCLSGIGCPRWTECSSGYRTRGLHSPNRPATPCRRSCRPRPRWRLPRTTSVRPYDATHLRRSRNLLRFVVLMLSRPSVLIRRIMSLRGARQRSKPYRRFQPRWGLCARVGRGASRLRPRRGGLIHPDFASNEYVRFRGQVFRGRFVAQGACSFMFLHQTSLPRGTRTRHHRRNAGGRESLPGICTTSNV